MAENQFIAPESGTYSWGGAVDVDAPVVEVVVPDFEWVSLAVEPETEEPG